MRSLKTQSCSPTPQSYFHSNLSVPEFYENRHELGMLCSWWRKAKGGLCALIGMGGSGKSALTQKFLSMLPAVTAASFEKDLSLSPPKAAFVFSFSDNPDPAFFFSALAAWLDTEQDP